MKSWCHTVIALMGGRNPNPYPNTALFKLQYGGHDIGVAVELFASAVAMLHVFRGRGISLQWHGAMSDEERFVWERVAVSCFKACASAAAIADVAVGGASSAALSAVLDSMHG